MYNIDLPNRAELPSSKKLLIATLIAGFVAAVLLVTVVLPAEYGRDPTRIGGVLGLKQMGEIKQRLAAENESSVNNAAIKEIKITDSNDIKSNEITVEVKPDKHVEIKVEMLKNAKLKYSWKTTGAVNFNLHGDGANNVSTSYRKGNEAASSEGELIADFDGNHGWYWRNTTNKKITIILKTEGLYKSIKRY